MSYLFEGLSERPKSILMGKYFLTDKIMIISPSEINEMG